MKELKLIYNYPNYAVSSDGVIWNVSKNTAVNIFEKSPNKENSYLRVELWSHGNGKKFSVHRLVAAAFIPNPENKSSVNHKDGNKQNNNIDNLEWVTNSENKKHAAENDLVAYGESNGQSVYTEDQINLVCKFIAEKNLSLANISSLTGVKYTTVKDINAKRSWVRVSSKYF